MSETSAAERPAPPLELQGRLRPYAWWQLRDYLIQKGIATALIGGLLLFLTWSALRASGVEGGAIPRAALVRKLVDQSFPQFIDNVILFGVLFATNGIVSEDRKMGYYRFLFAKPVPVAGYYGQKFVVHLIGLMLVTLLMLALHALVLEPRFPPALAAALPMIAVGLAGIGFLLSAIFTLDWITLLAVYAAAQIGWLLYGEDAGVRGALVRLLPPVHELLPIYRAITLREPVPMEPLWWIFLYGLACLGIGLVVVSRRNLATS